MSRTIGVFLGVALGEYHFGAAHPFGPLRQSAFEAEFRKRGLDRRATIEAPHAGNDDMLALFHTHEHIANIRQRSMIGRGYLDHGDTPARQGIFEAACTVVGSVCHAIDLVLHDTYSRAFVPIAGLHHARRDSAEGFCVFNDCGVAIEYLRQQGIRRIAYVDIDAHHGDGVFYAFEDDPELIFADIHEDGRYLFPGTGTADETGTGAAAGTKLNIPMPPGADDRAFIQAWERVEHHLSRCAPDFILLQCGADSLAGDPLTDLRYTSASHHHAATRLRRIADEHCHGRLVALGGGGYSLDNIATAWCAVVEALLAED